MLQSARNPATKDIPSACMSCQQMQNKLTATIRREEKFVRFQQEIFVVKNDFTVNIFNADPKCLQ